MRWVCGLLLALLIFAPSCCDAAEHLLRCPPLSQVPARYKALDTFLERESSGPADYEISISAFYDMCRREPKTVACAGGGAGKLTLAEVREIDARLRARFEYRSDALAFGQSDYYEPESFCSDCEDYALHLSQLLAAAGEGGKNMGLVLWFPDGSGAHATLAVKTADAGTVEVSVGSGGQPAAVNWKSGVRVAVLWMDGRRRFTAAPGWPVPTVRNGGVSVPKGARYVSP